MGRPFKNELVSIPDTINEAFSESINPLFKQIISTLSQFPLLVVGSGGSLSGAFFVARLHEQITGQMARAITPFELFYSTVNPSKNAILFLTASGNNKDILTAFDMAVQREFAEIAIICTKLGSKIAKKATFYTNVQIFEYSNPAGKDGFLAVNSLIASCILISRAYEAIDNSKNSIMKLTASNINFQNSDWNQVLSRNTLVALGGEWSWPALIDLESKFTEAALGNVLISDLKNFGHGRHNWFNKKGDDSALLVLETPQTALIVKKIRAIMPAKYPRAVLRSVFNGPMACIDLLIQVFHLVYEAGKRVNIDPGKPKVPEFGRKIYHLGISSAASKKTKNRTMWVDRKARASNLSHSVLKEYLNKFLEEIKQTRFAGVVFDYDGTLCDPPERFTQPNSQIASALNSLLSKEIAIGIATGRGYSVQDSLSKVIEEKYWDKVLIGNYNGSIIVKLNCDLPKKGGEILEIIKDIQKILTNDSLLIQQTNIKVKAKQISIFPKPGFTKQTVLKRLYEILYKFEKIKIVQSDHSIDILDLDVSKVYVVEGLRKILSNQNGEILIVGDQGQVRGNDFEILNLPYSLSVNKVSSSFDTCWNLSPPGVKGAKATLCILNALQGTKGKIRLETDYLEKRKVK